MDEKSYSKVAIDRFMNDNLFFKDAKLKKYFDRNEPRDLGKFRQRLHDKFPENTLEKMVYVVVTDSIRDIILDTIGELTEKLKSSGDLIVSGGEAFNLYVDFKDRIVTTDIDAKFVPFMKTDAKYFGKLQALKLLLWDMLGKYAKSLNARVKNRILSLQKEHSRLFKFMGIGFSGSGPYVTRRYTLIKKKKSGTTNKPSKSDIRPEKKVKDRLRLVKLGKLFDKRVTGSDSMDTVFKKIRSKLGIRKPQTTTKHRNVNIKRAKKVDPYRYKKYTTEPSKERLSKQLVHGLKTVTNNMNVEGFNKTYGNQRFDLKTLKWKNAKNNAYVKNEFSLRPTQAKKLPKNINVTNTLYGYRASRDNWINKKVLDDASAIPFIGLKK
jgi:ribosomal protein S24E